VARRQKQPKQDLLTVLPQNSNTPFSQVGEYKKDPAATSKTTTIVSIYLENSQDNKGE
jgi:hypothetical protein